MSEIDRHEIGSTTPMKHTEKTERQRIDELVSAIDKAVELAKGFPSEKLREFRQRTIPCPRREETEEVRDLLALGLIDAWNKIDELVIDECPEPHTPELIERAINAVMESLSHDGTAAARAAHVVLALGLFGESPVEKPGNDSSRLEATAIKLGGRDGAV